MTGLQFDVYIGDGQRQNSRKPVKNFVEVFAIIFNPLLTQN